MKKLLSVILSACLIFAYTPVLAATFDPDCTYTYTDYYLSDYDSAGSSEIKVNDVSYVKTAHGKNETITVDESDNTTIFKVITGDNAGVRRNIEKQGYGPRFDVSENCIAYSADVKWVGGLPTTNSSVISTKVWEYGSTDTKDQYWNNPLLVGSDGKIKVGGVNVDGTTVVTDYSVTTDVWYNFNTVWWFDKPNNAVWCDVIVKNLSTGAETTVISQEKFSYFDAFTDHFTVYRYNLGSTDGTYLYVDNLKLSKVTKDVPTATLSSANTNVGITKGRTVPASGKIAMAYTAEHSDGILENGGKIKVYNNGVYQGEGTEATGTVNVSIVSGLNAIHAEVVSASGTAVGIGEDFVLYGETVAPSTTMPGYSEDFEKSDSATHGGYVKNTYDSGSSYSYALGDEAHGKVAYMKQNASTTMTSNMRWNSSRMYTYVADSQFTSGRFIEMSADIKWNNNSFSTTAATLLTGFKVVNTSKATPSKTLTSATIAGSMSEASCGFYRTASGNLACYSASNDTGIEVDLSNWHNYKIIIDGELWNGTNTKAYYYYDDVLVWTNEKAATSFLFVDSFYVLAPKNTSTTDVAETFIDNVTFKTYDLSDGNTANLSNLTVVNGGKPVTDATAINSTEAITAKGYIGSDTASEDGESGNVILAVYKDNALCAVGINGVTIKKGYNSFTVSADNLPDDIAAGGYEFKLFVWKDASLTPYFNSTNLLTSN